MSTDPLLDDGWRYTRAILAENGMEVPYTIEFLLEGARQIRARVLRRSKNWRGETQHWTTLSLTRVSIRRTP
jgi:hypothetical protein